MPAKSQAQFDLFQGVAHGMKPPKGSKMTKAMAQEMVNATPEPKALPKRVAKKPAIKHVPLEPKKGRRSFGHLGPRL